MFWTTAICMSCRARIIVVIRLFISRDRVHALLDRHHRRSDPWRPRPRDPAVNDRIPDRAVAHAVDLRHRRDLSRRLLGARRGRPRGADDAAGVGAKSLKPPCSSSFRTLNVDYAQLRAQTDRNTSAGWGGRAPPSSDPSKSPFVQRSLTMPSMTGVDLAVHYVQQALVTSRPGAP